MGGIHNLHVEMFTMFETDISYMVARAHLLNPGARTLLLTLYLAQAGMSVCAPEGIDACFC